MFGFGGYPHLLFIALAGLVWLVIIAVIAGILFLIIRFAVLSALKAHSRWYDAGKPEVSAWSARPASHPGPVAQPGDTTQPRSAEMDAAATSAADATMATGHVAPEPPAPE